jgi:perosamine synthetase
VSPAAPIRAYPHVPPPFAPPRRGPRPFPLGEPGVALFRFARAGIFHGLRAFGVGDGDEVLMPEYHHGVEVEAVRALGATVRFYPLGRDLRADVGAVRAAVSAKTRVIYALHYFGFPQPLAALRALAEERGVILLEDCALSLLSREGRTPLGSAGDLSIFCLYKTLPLPDGGLLWIRAGRAAALAPARAARWGARGLLREARRLLSAPKPAPTSPLDPGYPEFDRRQLAAKISPLSRALLAGLDLDAVCARRRALYRFWSEATAGWIEGFAPALADGVCPLFYPVLVADKPGLCRALLASGVEVHDWWGERRGGARPGESEWGDYLRRHLIGLPVRQDLRPEEAAQIYAALKRHLPAYT